jgi:hypothetical protein
MYSFFRENCTSRPNLLCYNGVSRTHRANMTTPAAAKLKLLSGKMDHLNKLTKAELIQLVESVRPDIALVNNPDHPLWGDEKGNVIGYMDKVDWDYEIGGAAGGNKIFPSIDDLKHCKPCVDSCGIVEVEVRLRRIIKESDFSERISAAKKRKTKSK